MAAYVRLWNGVSKIWFVFKQLMFIYCFISEDLAQAKGLVLNHSPQDLGGIALADA